MVFLYLFIYPDNFMRSSDESLISGWFRNSKYERSFGNAWCWLVDLSFWLISIKQKAQKYACTEN